MPLFGCDKNKTQLATSNRLILSESFVMAALSSGRIAMDLQNETQNGTLDRLKRLYPAVNEEKTPLPRAWSPKEKYGYIGLSQGNLRVHYKGKSELSRFV